MPVFFFFFFFFWTGFLLIASMGEYALCFQGKVCTTCVFTVDFFVGCATGVLDFVHGGCNLTIE
jgi:hypothetical protein